MFRRVILILIQTVYPLITAASTLPPSLRHQFVGSLMSASGADEAIGPAAGRKVLLTGLLGSEVALKLP
jgi:hypothetical protein